jgi:hypothetical protein
MKYHLPVRGACLALALCGALAGCGGTILLKSETCSSDDCPDGKVCDAGKCVTPRGPCNPENLVGVCPHGAYCQSGVCFPSDNRPDRCQGQTNGLCGDPAQACVDSACRSITAGEACAATNPSGLCPGGSICLQGSCFATSALCSSARPDGACQSAPAEPKRCQNGTCITADVTCSLGDFSGTCPGWQSCVQGSCVGPIAPDAC